MANESGSIIHHPSAITDCQSKGRCAVNPSVFPGNRLAPGPGAECEVGPVVDGLLQEGHVPVGEEEVDASSRVVTVELVDVPGGVAGPFALAGVAENHAGGGLGPGPAD